MLQNIVMGISSIRIQFVHFFNDADEHHSELQEKFGSLQTF